MAQGELVRKNEMKVCIKSFGHVDMYVKNVACDAGLAVATHLGSPYPANVPSPLAHSYSYALALNGNGMPVFVGEFDVSLVGPPAPTLYNSGLIGMVVSTSIPDGPSLLPLHLKSISVKDGSPLYGNQRALLGKQFNHITKAAKNATYIKMHKDRCGSRPIYPSIRAN